MSDPAPQLELGLVMAPQPLDEFLLRARTLLARPEVEYEVFWRAPDGRQQQQRCFLDAIWPLDRMSSRIIDLIVQAHGGNMWEVKKVRACLDAIQSAYGCQEPF